MDVSCISTLCLYSKFHQSRCGWFVERQMRGKVRNDTRLQFGNLLYVNIIECIEINSLTFISPIVLSSELFCMGAARYRSQFGMHVWNEHFLLRHSFAVRVSNYPKNVFLHLQFFVPEIRENSIVGGSGRRRSCGKATCK